MRSWSDVAMSMAVIGAMSCGAVATTDAHSHSCISDVDREHITKGIAVYEATFGPLSEAADGDAYAGAMPSLFPIFPIGGTVWDEIHISNFVDLDPGSGVLDFQCGSITYDGHNGSDTSLLSWDQQLIGVPIVAVLDGVVVDAHDGEFDMNTEWKGQPANYVIVDHGDGRLCYYWHMKQWSVIVEPGQQVRAGEQLGLIASSGNSSGPHLHFTTLDSGVRIEPFAGECNPVETQWVDQIEVPSDTYPIDFAVTTVDLTAWYKTNHHRWRPPYENQIPLDHDRLRIWLQGTNLPLESTIRFQFFFPSGEADYDSGEWDITFPPQHYLRWRGWWNFNLTDMHKTTGTWTVEISINGEPFITAPIEVVKTVDPEFNRPPESVQATLEPSLPSVTDVITCRLDTAGALGDLDWDLVRYLYRWTIDGTVVREVTSAGRADHLPRGWAPAGSHVTCTVTPSDGTEDGTPVDASTVVSGGCPDFNGDGTANGADLGLLLVAWGSCIDCQQDLSGDGLVNGIDLGLFLVGYGACP